MRKLISIIILISSLVCISSVGATTYYNWRYRDGNDCTTLTDGRLQDLCYQADGKLYKCVPNGDDVCDTPAEWHTPTADTLWGSIGGTLSSQTDLQAILDTKLEAVANDTTPQLGGDLDVNGHNIVGDVVVGTPGQWNPADPNALLNVMGKAWFDVTWTGWGVKLGASAHDLIRAIGQNSDGATSTYIAVDSRGGNVRGFSIEEEGSPLWILGSYENAPFTIKGYNGEGTVLSIQNGTGNVGIKTDSSDTDLTLNGDFKLLRVDAPTTAPTAAVSTEAGNLSGDIYYTVTFVTDKGETETSPFSEKVTVSNQKVDLTNIPTGPSDVIARKIYRNSFNGYPPSGFKLVTTLNDNISTTFIDNVANGDLGDAPPNYNTTGAMIYVNNNVVGAIDSNSLVLGVNAGPSNKGIDDIFMGPSVGSLCSGDRNVVIGGNIITGGNTFNCMDNVVIGQNAVEYGGGIPSSIVAIGARAAQGTSSTFINTQNVAIGTDVLKSIHYIDETNGIGVYALSNDTDGRREDAFGAYALAYLIDGNYNSAFGNRSLMGLQHASYNVGFGSSAGWYIADGSTDLTTANHDVFIGAKTKALQNNSDNEIVIGYDAVGAGSNSVVIGNDAITKTVLKGNVGLPTDDPKARLEVNGGVRLNPNDTKPTCDVDHRGTIWFTKGDPGVADTLEICIKDASDTYTWKIL